MMILCSMCCALMTQEEKITQQKADTCFFSTCSFVSYFREFDLLKQIEEFCIMTQKQRKTCKTLQECFDTPGVCVCLITLK